MSALPIISTVKKTLRIITVLVVLTFIIVIAGIRIAYAISTAVSVPLNGGKDGDLVSFVNGKYALSAVEYDKELYGVIVADPALSLQDRNYSINDSRLVQSNGEAYVNVTGTNGNIKEGDYITSSKLSGLAQKADRPGVVAGIALEDFLAPTTEATGKIKVMVNIKAAVVASTIRGNLIEALKEGSYAPILTPLTSLRYILAALVTASCFIIAFFSFGKASKNSMQALGRNPLAKKDINKGLLFSFALTFAILFVGLGVSYLILVF